MEDLVLVFGYLKVNCFLINGLPELLNCPCPISPKVAFKCKGESCCVSIAFGSSVKNSFLPSAQAFIAELEDKVKLVCPFVMQVVVLGCHFVAALQVGARIGGC